MRRMECECFVMNGEPREAAKVYVAERVVSTAKQLSCAEFGGLGLTPGAIAVVL